MLCLYHIGRTATPMSCTNACPYRQKLIYGLETKKMLMNQDILVPLQDITELFSQLQRDFRYVGYYQFNCTEWNLLVDEEKHYFFMNSIHDMVDLDKIKQDYSAP